MESIRCVFANMPHQLLADIVKSMVDENHRMEVVGRVNSTSEAASLIASSQVDMLVMGMNSSEWPASCIELKQVAADLPILGLVDDGRSLALYLNNVGRDDISKIVNTLQQVGTGSS